MHKCSGPIHGHISQIIISENDSGNNYTLPVATEEKLGGIKIGNNLKITEDGFLSVDIQSLPEVNFDNFTGATNKTDGTHGFVPAPTINDIEKFLSGDGTWKTIPKNKIIVSNTGEESFFNNITTWEIEHNLNSKYIHVSVYETITGKQIMPEINLIDENKCKILIGSENIIEAGTYTAVII